MTTMTKPERWAHKGQVMRHQCRACRHRVDTGETAWGVPVFDCAKNLNPPGKRICPLFVLDEGSEMIQQANGEASE